MMSAAEDRLKKLRWQSRRGMKELDIVLERFFRNHRKRLLQGDWPQLERLLDQEDDVLLDWVSGRVRPQDSELNELLEELKRVT